MSDYCRCDHETKRRICRVADCDAYPIGDILRGHSNDGYPVHDVSFAFRFAARVEHYHFLDQVECEESGHNDQCIC